MKRLLISSLLLTAAVLILPSLPQKGAAPAAPTERISPAPEAVVKKAEKLVSDNSREISLLVGDEPVKMSVRDYLVGVVAAEMPVSFEPEALKAQAVAARSYLQRVSGTKHDDADICADASCCQAYLSADELREGWGDNYDAYLARIGQAVDATDGEYLAYEGEPALAAFHSSSSKMTEDSSSLWGELPYLKSVETPESEQDVPNFVSTLELSALDFRDTILYAEPDADMTGDAEHWVGETVRDAAHRVEAVTIGGVSFTGQRLRELFSLRSADFEITCSDGKFTFTVLGYGHGVGMSQYGANVMAKGGSDYAKILSHYYPGTELIRP